MPASKLVRPDPIYKQSFIEALHEYQREGRCRYYEIPRLMADFEDFVEILRAEKGYPHKPYQDWVEPVPETVLWLVTEDVYLGTVDIRHRLNWHLEKWGGHVHFIIRPSMRGKGFGNRILQKAMPFVNYLGIDRALLTVAPDNVPGRKVVEYCGGVLQDETPETEKFPARLRYWLDCT